MSVSTGVLMVTVRATHIGGCVFVCAAHILAAGKAPVLVIGASWAVNGLSASGSWFPGREKQRSLRYRIKQIMRIGRVDPTKVCAYVSA